MKKEHQEENKNPGFSRRSFLSLSSVASLMFAVKGYAQNEPVSSSLRNSPAPAELFSAPPIETVRIGYVGVGGMGTNHVKNLLQIEGVQIKAICDIVPEKVERAKKMVVAAGQPEPKGYTNGEWDFKRMCQEEDLDLVYTATPWEWHTPVCVAAMENGKHAATEVPAAVTLEECWQLVETSEKLKKHCVMMENCCYNRTELMMLHMIRKGLLGEVIHGECGYLHDLRGLKFSNSGEGLWRRAHAIKRNGNLYPTHGLGPVAQYMNINRGDQFEYLVSVSSKSRGLQEYQKTLPENDPRRKEQFALGDVNVSIIKTYSGCTIYLVHDTNLPRPYSRINTIQGTKGIIMDYPPRIFVEGLSKEEEGFEPLEKYAEQWEHPLWKKLQESAKGAGHGGMDFIEDYRLIECLRNGLPTDQNVYDAASWSAVSELTERSVAQRGAPQDFPDFTRGRWKEYPQLGIIYG
ncbi:MAG TPA: Gfo/Idh/MocA family oxidoreductase [Candidatus Hydrogenedens sp.]|nr:Gfo/Idh/MocA family oxidoreductase [Candidatus Hydrogenedens sp.]